MTGQIDAALRLVRVADKALHDSTGHVDGFVRTLADTTMDATGRTETARGHLTSAVDTARTAAAAVTAAHTAAGTDGGAAVALAELADTKTGALQLSSTLDTLLAGGGSGNVRIDPAAISAQITSVRSSAERAGTALREAHDGSSAGDEVFDAVAQATKANKPETMTDGRIDDAINAARSSMPTLESVATNMITAARSGKYNTLVGREPEVDQLLTVLGRKQKSNPILLGDAGVGKTQLVEGLALRVVRGEVPDAMKDLKIYAIDGSTLKAAAGDGQGAMEKLVQQLVTEVTDARANGDKVALFVDEMHTLMNAGETAQQLKPALARGDISMIGATTWEEFNKFISDDAALVRRVAPITVDELESPQVLDVLRSVQTTLSKHHGVVAYDTALQEAQTLAGRYVRDRKQPDPAIELLDHAMSRVAKSWKGGMPADVVKLTNDVNRLKETIPALERQVAIGDTRAAAQFTSSRNQLAELEPKLEAAATQLNAEREVLTARQDLVQQYLAHMEAGQADAARALEPQLASANEAVSAMRQQYPERMLNDLVDDVAVREAASNLYGRTISAGGAEEAERALKLGDELAARVIGQRGATDRIAEAMIGVKSGMKDPNSPAGAFLFLGPTGTGKTETVRVTADVMTGDPKNMVRIDMGEFSEPHSISKLFGSPPGYVGYGDAPALADLIKNPEAHVLFDEVEKAHPSIFQKLLPLFEEGRVTLADGTTVDASGATLYMTSNLPEKATATKPGLRDFFSPEFLNRLDAVVNFGYLEREHVQTILDDLLLPGALKRAADNGLDVKVTDAAKDRILDYGFDSAMGARPLKRSLKNHVTQPSGTMLLKMRAAGRQVEPGAGQTAILDVADGGGFVMRSEDGALSVVVDGRPASEHAPGAAQMTHGPAPTTNEPAPQWSLADDASAAATPPAPDANPILPGGE